MLIEHLMNGVARNHHAFDAAADELVGGVLKQVGDGFPIACRKQRREVRVVEAPQDDVAASAAAGQLQDLEIDQLIIFQAGGPTQASKYSKSSDGLHDILLD